MPLDLSRPGFRSESVRQANLSAILRELHMRGALSRSELVVATGLTRSGIRAVIGDLVTSGLAVEERAESQGTPGRPSPLVRADPTGAAVLALEISVDSMAAATMGLGGEVLDHVRADRPRGRFAVEETVDDLLSLARPLIARQARRDTLTGIGVGVVGVVRRGDGLVRTAPNLGWHDVPLRAILAEALGLDLPIAIANEADLGALAEHRRGAARDVDNVVFISGEVGVGGGLIVDGRPLVGVAGYGGEIGHIPLNPAGDACRCGSVGCWETEVGERALLKRTGRGAAAGPAAIDEILDDAAGGDPVALGALENVARWLGRGLAGLVNALNPELIVLGGLHGRVFPFVESGLRAELDRLSLDVAGDLVKVVPAELGMEASLIGAAELAFEPLLADPQALAPTRLPARATA